ncbi:MAG TPA: GNAT family protein [Thermomicrobiales bacterium]|nr:GNAT family protein [Thermomicrobiales bacterium]
MVTPELHGERIWLRPIRRTDAFALAEATNLEDETGFHEDGRVPLSILSFESWIDGLSDAEIVFAVCRKGDDTCIGTMSIRDIDQDNGTAETGSGLLNRADRGQGLGTEAKQLVLRYAFEVLGLHALRSTVFEGNRRSARALEKQGYRFAGRLTAHVLATGGVIGDALFFDITRDDWERMGQSEMHDG